MTNKQHSLNGQFMKAFLHKSPNIFSSTIDSYDWYVSFFNGKTKTHS